MNEEARYFWCLQNIARATALQELNSIPRTDLKEMMAYITAFEVKYPELDFGHFWNLMSKIKYLNL